MRARVIAVIGQGSATPETDRQAREIGRLLAEAGCVVVTGGLGGVMAAASLGAHQAGGLVIGVLPSGSPEDANPHVDVAIATGVGDADTTGDIQGAEIGAEDYDLLLRAERQGGGSGRIYAVTYEAVDASANRSEGTAEVTVRHSQSNDAPKKLPRLRRRN